MLLQALLYKIRVMKTLTGEELPNLLVDNEGRPSKYLHSTLFGRVLSEDVKKDKKAIEFGDGKKLTKGTYMMQKL